MKSPMERAVELWTVLYNGPPGVSNLSKLSVYDKETTLSLIARFVLIVEDEILASFGLTRFTVDPHLIKVRFKWRSRSGDHCQLELNTTSLAFARKTAMETHGYPGHGGGWFNYLVDDIRALFKKLDRSVVTLINWWR
jgi:hypothetical protein